MSEYPPLPIVEDWSPAEREFHKATKEHVEGRLSLLSESDETNSIIDRLEALESNLASPVFKRTLGRATTLNTLPSLALSTSDQTAIIVSVDIEDSSSNLWCRFSASLQTVSTGYLTAKLFKDSVEIDAMALFQVNSPSAPDLVLKDPSPTKGVTDYEVTLSSTVTTSMYWDGTFAVFDEIRT